MKAFAVYLRSLVRKGEHSSYGLRRVGKTEDPTLDICEPKFVTFCDNAENHLALLFWALFPIAYVVFLSEAAVEVVIKLQSPRKTSKVDSFGPKF